jgi:O-antigen/teichoic acid export membrane protein
MLKKTFQDSASFLLVQVSTKFFGLISFPIITRNLSVHDYGVLSLVNATLLLLYALGKCGVPRALIFYTKKESSCTPVRLLYKAVISVLMVSLTLVGGYVLIVHSASIDEPLRTALLVVAPLVVFKNTFQVILAWFRAISKISVHNVLNSAYELGSSISGLVVLVLFSKTVTGLLFGKALYEGIFFIFLFVYLFRIISLPRDKSNTFSFKELLSYGFPLIWLEISTIIIAFGDRYQIGYILGGESVGIYSVGYSISLYAQQLLSQPIVLAIFPIYNQLYNTEGASTASKYLNKVFHHYLGLAICIFTFLSYYSSELVTLYASEKYIDSIPVVPICLAGCLVGGAVPIISAGLYLNKKTKKVASLTFCSSLLNVLLNFLFINLFGIVGAAYSTVVSFLFLFWMLFVVNNKTNVKVEFRFITLVKFFAISGLAICCTFWADNNSLFGVVISGLCYVSVYSILYLVVNPMLFKLIVEKAKSFFG